MKEQEIVGEGKKKGSVHKMWRMSGILFEFPTKAERVAAGGLRVVSRAHVPRSVSRRVFAWKGRQGAAPTGGGWGGWRQRWQAATGEVRGGPARALPSRYRRGRCARRPRGVPGPLSSRATWARAIFLQFEAVRAGRRGARLCGAGRQLREIRLHGPYDGWEVGHTPGYLSLTTRTSSLRQV